MTSLDILEQFGSVRRCLGRAISPFLQEINIGPKQLVVLRAIGKRGECSMSEIAEATASDMASVTRMVTCLVSSNWVEKQKSEGDQRQWVVKLAAKGLEQWDTINSLVQDIAEVFVSELDKAEQKEFLRLLNKAQKGMDSSHSLRTVNAIHSSANKIQE